MIFGAQQTDRRSIAVKRPRCEENLLKAQRLLKAAWNDSEDCGTKETTLTIIRAHRTVTDALTILEGEPDRFGEGPAR